MSIPESNINQFARTVATKSDDIVANVKPFSASSVATDPAGSFASSGFGGKLLNAPPLKLPTEKMDKVLSQLSSGGSVRSRMNFGKGSMNFGGGSAPKTKRSKDSLWSGLIKMFVGMIQLPGKFKLITNAIDGAGKSVAFGIDGMILSTYLAVKDIAVLLFSILTFVVKYLGCIIQFFLTLPFCFVSHIIWCIWKVFYLIFPFTSCMCWYMTGYELMPMYNKFFEFLDNADDTVIYPTLGFYLTKFPPSIIKLCYTCNNKVLRLSQVTKDTAPIVRAGKQFGYDMGVKAPQYMRPAKPHMYKVAVNMDRLFK
jgi:hypothetical protein